MLEDDKPREVGYKNPPKHTQYKQGKSGNPAGRPKGVKNLQTIYRKVLNQRVLVLVNGKSKEMVAYEALMQRLLGKALAGDLKALNMILTLHRVYEDAAPQETAPMSDEKANKILQDLMKQMKEMSSDGESEPAIIPSISPQEEDDD